MARRRRLHARALPGGRRRPPGGPAPQGRRIRRGERALKAGARKRAAEWLASGPSLLWLGLFFLVPTLLVFVLAFRPADPVRRHRRGLDAREHPPPGRPGYARGRPADARISLATTVICLVLAVPVGYTLARVSAKWRNFFLMLVIIPFWTNFLIRVFAWKTLLHPEGPIKQVLVFLGLVPSGASLLYTAGGRGPGLGLYVPAVHHPADLRRGREVRFPADRGGPGPRGAAVRRLPQDLPAGHPPGPRHRRPLRLHPRPGVLRHPRHRRRPGRRDDRQQDRPAGLRRPQPAAGQRPVGRPHPVGPRASRRRPRPPAQGRKGRRSSRRSA